MKILLTLFYILVGTQVWAGFDFGECSGSGTFQQNIKGYAGDYEKTVDVGEIPEGIKGLYVELLSDRDVDIRLYGNTTDKIVHWPLGLLSREYEESTNYQGVSITYSGYNGKDGQRGHEFIKVDGTTPVALQLKAFGFRSGVATVNYSWTGREGCEANATGASSFTQYMRSQETATVGRIPENITNLEINLTSETDIDIQLYGEDGTAIVSWKPKGLLSGSSKSSVDYNGMHIEWSGYAGINGQAGHEYIKISNTTTEILTMKVFGYEAGSASVSYSWGKEEKLDLAYKYAVATQGSRYSNTDYPASNVLDKNDTTFNHTALNDTVGNWVQLKFPAKVSFEKLIIKNRQRRMIG